MERRLWLCLLAVLLAGLMLTAAAFSKGTHIKGGPGDDELRGTGGFNVIEGRGGDDVIYGLGQFDKLFGDHPADRGRTGDDVIYGGDGNDELQGGRGADKVFGGEGDDKLEESRFVLDFGPDLLNGGQGSDICFRQKPDRTTGCEAVAHYDLKSETKFPQLVCERGCALLESRYGSDFVKR